MTTTKTNEPTTAPRHEQSWGELSLQGKFNRASGYFTGGALITSGVSALAPIAGILANAFNANIPLEMSIMLGMTGAVTAFTAAAAGHIAYRVTADDQQMEELAELNANSKGCAIETALICNILMN